MTKSTHYSVLTSCLVSAHRDCPQFLNMTASVLYIHFDELEKKAETYGSLATLVSVLLVVLMVMFDQNLIAGLVYSDQFILFLCFCIHR